MYFFRYYVRCHIVISSHGSTARSGSGERKLEAPATFKTALPKYCVAAHAPPQPLVGNFEHGQKIEEVHGGLPQFKF